MTRQRGKTPQKAPTLAALHMLFWQLERRGIVDFEPYIRHLFGKGPDPDAPSSKRPYRNPWTHENT